MDSEAFSRHDSAMRLVCGLLTLALILTFSASVSAQTTSAAEGKLQLTLESEPKGLLWSAEQSRGKRVTLCAAPCEVKLDAGVYRLGLAPKGRDPVFGADLWTLRTEDRLKAKYTSNRPLRIGGGAMIAAGMTIGAGAILLGRSDRACATDTVCTYENSTIDDEGKRMIITGAIVAAVTVIVGAIMIMQRDTVEIRGDRAHRAPPHLAPPVDAPSQNTYAASDSAVSRVVWACADRGTTSLTLRVQLDRDGVVSSIEAPSEQSLLARACLDNNLPGTLLASGATGAATLVFQKQR